MAIVCVLAALFPGAVHAQGFPSRFADNGGQIVVGTKADVDKEIAADRLK